MFLKESLFALLETKPIEKITPTELFRHAGINRNTFYSHYCSPEELLDSVESEILEIIMASISKEKTFVNTGALLSEQQVSLQNCGVLILQFIFWVSLFSFIVSYC